MNVPWGLVSLVFGFAYGALKAGRQDKSEILKKGIVIGIVIALVLTVIGVLTNAPALGLAGGIGIVLAAIFLTLLFVLGVWLGDLLTAHRRHV